MGRVQIVGEKIKMSYDFKSFFGFEVSEYAGIGSRNTPENIQNMMTSLARELCRAKIHLRTGNAAGADHAFIEGVNQVQPYAVSLYLPFRNYRTEFLHHNNGICVAEPDKNAIEKAGQYHPGWHRCSEKSKKFHGRNVQIILGSIFTNPVDFVVCYCANEKSGGTAFGINVARQNNIPVFNLFVEDDWLKIKRLHDELQELHSRPLW